MKSERTDLQHLSADEHKERRRIRTKPHGRFLAAIRRIWWMDWQRRAPKPRYRAPRVLLWQDDGGFPLNSVTVGAFEERIRGQDAYIVRVDDATAKALGDASQIETWRVQNRRTIQKVSAVEPHGAGTFALFIAPLSDRATKLSTATVTKNQTKRIEAPLETLYGEVSNAWRQLTEVRFKLLGLVPLVTGIGLVNLAENTSGLEDAERVVRVAVGVLGLLVTIFLLMYERRNSELYDDLISRGKLLEHQMGFTTGVFLGRKHGRWPIRHDTALLGIYWAAIAAWIVVIAAISTAGHGDAAPPADKQPPISVPAVATGGTPQTAVATQSTIKKGAPRTP
jgi:hypothetical protein